MAIKNAGFLLVCLTVSVSGCVSLPKEATPKETPPVAADPSIVIDPPKIDVSCIQENAESPTPEKTSGNPLGNILGSDLLKGGVAWIERQASPEGRVRKGITVEWPSEDSELCKARMPNFKCDCRRTPGQARKRLSRQ